MKTKLFLIVIFSCIIIHAQDKTKGFVLAIHGGAGTILKGSITAEEEKAYRDKMEEALKAGYNVLKSNGSSLDAVEKAVNILEDSPLFNAGKGAVFNSRGKNELDASIMDGRTLMAGAVAGVMHVKNPVSLARLVMERSPHVMLTGKGAEEFAESQGVELVEENYFFYEKRWQQYLKEKEREEKRGKDENKSGIIQPEEKYGTVGAAALDKKGNLAAATSTGGMTYKRFGRVGDSPIIGAGTYAKNSTCAVSATGHGEFFIRNVVAYDISALMEYKGLSLQQAADEVINKKLLPQGGTGGVIAVDSKGNVAMPFNTEGMYRGFIREDGTMEVHIYRD